MVATSNDIYRFTTYVKNHAHIVRVLGQSVFDRDYSKHDADKRLLSDEDLNLYALRNKKFNVSNLELPEQVKAKIDRLVAQHIKQNSHHPEFWDSSITVETFTESELPVCHAEAMPEEALKEMCCDWAAVALARNQELSKWYNDVVDSRFKFSDEQKDLIQKYLKMLNKYILEHNISFPGKPTYSPKAKCKFKEGEKLMKSVAITFGRMNPFTKGHLLVCKQLHELNTDAKYIYLSHSYDGFEGSINKDPSEYHNPLPYDLKILYAKEFLSESSYPDVKVVASDAKSILEVAQELYNKGFSNLIAVVGSDRLREFERLLNKYNNRATSSGDILYNFDSIEVVSAGNRDESSGLDGNNLETVSASKVRAAAAAGDFESFAAGVPTENQYILKDLYKDLRHYMGLNS